MDLLFNAEKNMRLLEQCSHPQMHILCPIREYEQMLTEPLYKENDLDQSIS